jgi:hypothetical protein
MLMLIVSAYGLMLRSRLAFCDAARNSDLRRVPGVCLQKVPRGARRPGQRPGPGTNIGRQNQSGLRALFFYDQRGFPGGFFFAVGAGDVAEGRGIGLSRVEIGKWALTLGNSVVSAADNRRLGGERMRLGMERVAGRLDDLRLVGQHGDADLSEGGGGAENEHG